MAELLRTPLHGWHVANKARMVPFAGWEMPVQYAGIIPEHTAVRTGCGLFDVSHMGRLEFPGTDARPLLEEVFTNSVSTMKNGQVRYGLVCRDDGGILDDVLVYRWGAGEFSMVVNGSNREKIAAWLKTQAGKLGNGSGAIDHTFDTCLIAVQGPKAVELVSGLFGTDVSDLKYYFARITTYRGEWCMVSRTGYTGEDGFEVSVANKLAAPLWEELIGRGAVACGLGARDTLRLEAAMPLYGHELNEQTDPISAGLGWAVKFDKEFVGRNALQNLPPGRPLRVGLELEGKRAAREGSEVFADGSQVGTVTSGSFVPHLQKSIAMAYLPRAFATPGTEVLIDLRGTKVPAKVVLLPFYKRSK
ncbi:MAG: glycine cleavage system aminomethyltransferase GcvT [Fimbriiglobus sp.]|nr:glycine cleavage system aminomethyltransferase GcvT [Fimbriiglobus sp.]